MKIRNGFVLSLLAIALSASPALASGEEKPAGAPVSTETPATATSLENRINEIKAMDRSTLSREDRKALRKELRDIKKEARRSGGGIYLSTGAIIIIVLVILFVL